MEQAPDFGMVHFPQELLNAYQEYKRLQDWQQLLQRVLEGEPRAVLFAEKMVTNKQVSAKMLKKYERELLPLACFYIKVKKIWYANNCIKARYGPDPAADCSHLWCQRIMALLKHLFLCNKRENCQVSDCNETYKVVEHIVNCPDRERCFLCYPIAKESHFHEDMAGLIKEKQPFNAGTEMYYTHYSQVHFLAIAFYRTIWKLVLLDIMHAYFCSPAEVEDCKCELMTCREYRKLLKHMKDCPKEAACENYRCCQFKRIVMHWNTCKDVECSICKDSRNEFSKPMDLEAWDRGEVKHEKYPALDSDSCLTESMAKLKFTQPQMAIVFPDEESEKKGFKTVAYHLVMLHHATSCDLPPSECQVPPCEVIKKTISHLDECQVPEGCPEPYCQQTRLLRDHWNSCPAPECSLCDVVQEFKKRGRLVPTGPDPNNAKAIKL